LDKHIQFDFGIATGYLDVNIQITEAGARMTLLSQTAEYALRAAVWLASHPEQAMTTQAIAEGTQVPAGYLSKVLQSLGRAGLVRSQRGQGGGFGLARAAERISALDVINAVAPLERIHTCPLHLPQHRGALCPLHQKLDDAVVLLERSFGSTSLAELLEGNGRSRPLGLPRPRARRAIRARP
jgi:Rrf2 family protein